MKIERGGSYELDPVCIVFIWKYRMQIFMTLNCATLEILCEFTQSVGFILTHRPAALYRERRSCRLAIAFMGS